MIGAFLAAGFQSNAFQTGGQPIPVTWGNTGGIEKRKYPLKKNERSSIEAAVSNAISRITDPPEPSKKIQESQVRNREFNLYAFDEALLRKHAAQLNRDIEEYRHFLMMAERDDEEALLLLL